MARVMLITFLGLGWAWFELSGGTEFTAGDTGVQVLAKVEPVAPAAPAAVTPAPDLAETVTRDETPALTTLAVAEPRPAQVKTVFAPASQIAADGDRFVALESPPVMSDAVLVDVAAENDPVPSELPPVDLSSFGSAPLDLTASGLSAAPLSESVAASQTDYRTVTGSRVNLRLGPATTFAVVTQLLRGEEVEVLDDTGNGWVKLRALDGSDVGWMADSFLTSSLLN
jgi:hypothetical protein